MDVVCTAGHVDHGKSSLVRALTGMQPDRFAEEQQRGLTIDIGFAWADLGDPVRTVAFVDLPGHERFIPNMLAGAGAVEVALFVVAADEGWMPQSQEHLDILDLLGVNRGLVALTKADTVDEETIALGKELVREQLAPTAFAGVDVVAVSAQSGQGLDELVKRLGKVLADTPATPDRGRPRLWVDRSFSIRGAGTVVTGTLAGGSVAVGDELLVLPERERGRVRGLETLHRATQVAPPGSRLAVNLGGLDRADIQRGDAVGRVGQWRAVDRLDAWARALPGHELKRRGAWRLHAGSAQRVARVFPLLGPVGEQGGLVRLELDRALALAAGDRFVLRDAGRHATAGGGLVLDAGPPARPRGSRKRLERAEDLQHRLSALDAGDLQALFALHVRERGTDATERAAALVGLTSRGVTQAVTRYDLIAFGDATAHPDAVADWSAAIVAGLAGSHSAHPLERAAPKDVATRAATAAGCPPQLIPPLLDLLLERGTIVAEGPRLRTPEHAVRLDPAQQAAREALLAALAAQPFSPPGLRQAAQQAGAPDALVRELETDGAIIRLAPDLGVTAAALDAAAGVLKRAFDAEGPLTAARAKELLVTSRKFALPLLEELDRRGRTRRRGDLREVVR